MHLCNAWRLKAPYEVTLATRFLNYEKLSVVFFLNIFMESEKFPLLTNYPTKIIELDGGSYWYIFADEYC